MNKRNVIPTNQNEMLDYMDDSADLLDQQRLAGLHEEQNFQLIKNEILKREKVRLESKHGNSHPAVQQIQSRMAYNEKMFAGLDKEIENASIKTTPLPTTAWRVHGKVLNNESKPVKGVTVFLADTNIKWIMATGNSCTNELGYYSLTIDEKHADQKLPMHLAVSDKNKTILYFSSTAIFAAKGKVDLFDIYLKGEDCITPPVDVNRNPNLPPDAWVVKGKVTDENDKGLEGLTISLYDKDLFFDDVLGTVLSNKNGNFEFIYRTEAFESLFDKKPDIYLKVLDAKGKELYMSKNKVRPGAGCVEEFNIKMETNRKV